MNLHKLAVITFLLIFTGSCAQKNIYESQWIEDGHSKELPVQYDSDTKISFDVSNDKNHLYLRLLFIDEFTVQHVMMAGVKVWIDSTKKHNETFGLFYPIAHGPGNRNQQPDHNENRPPGEIDRRQNYIQSQLQYQTIGYSGLNNDLHFIHEQNEIDLNLSYIKNEALYYTAKIPLRYFNVGNLDNLDQNHIFSITVNIPGLPQRENSRPPQSGQRGAGRGGPPPGGSENRGGPPRDQQGSSGGINRPDFSSKKEIKIRFQFSIN